MSLEELHMDNKVNRLIPDNLLVSGKIIKAYVEKEDESMDQAFQEKVVKSVKLLYSGQYMAPKLMHILGSQKRIKRWSKCSSKVDGKQETETD